MPGAWPMIHQEALWVVAAEILRCAQNDRKRAREAYRLEQKTRKEKEFALLKEIKY